MKVIVFGATGMVGQGVLRECLLDPDVTDVRTIGRTATGQQHPKCARSCTRISRFLHHRKDIAGYDACFFCLGVTSLGLDEERYRHLTYDITLAAARPLARLNPGMTFVMSRAQALTAPNRAG